jgi:hypothetical protein
MCYLHLIQGKNCDVCKYSPRYSQGATSKRTVAPPRLAMIADALEFLPSQMTLGRDKTVF